MVWCYSDSKILQIYYGTFGEAVELPARFAVLKETLNVATLKEIDLKTAIKHAKIVLIKRGTALGDILILSAVVQQIKRHRQKFLLACQKRHLDSGIPQLLGIWDGFLTIDNVTNVKKYDIGIDFDRVFELDHHSEKYQKIARVKLAMDALHSSRSPEWDINKHYTKNKTVIIQTSGSFPQKELPSETLQAIIQMVKDMGYTPLCVGRNERVKRGSDYFDLIGTASFIITMDSSPLWISHYTKTRTILILGPTAEEQRLTYHPLYPRYAKAVKLYEKVNCQPCHEQLGACNGRISCLKVDKDYVVSEIKKIIQGWK